MRTRKVASTINSIKPEWTMHKVKNSHHETGKKNNGNTGINKYLSSITLM
jgi:hypothetical protein